jgi:hypothetical protein
VATLNIVEPDASNLWVERWRKKVARGDVIVVRYADDTRSTTMPGSVSCFSLPIHPSTHQRRCAVWSRTRRR